ncbi:MAG: GNAT family N-acetyltransferase [Finegoldia magna]|uniref:GNAT family N-acetyltransferase n=1 Tax=Finegoldia magna TaxID=1260 RepID=UPI000B918E65|nr:GNAT family N-acetyltransferase [Finegoldia magna]MBS5967239.1 GNAT family N-acetyltransferase [Finegoldia magna]MDU1009746.1 GNAT family N-acetyltransferase [Finegoldia magna]MDU1087828.1 GNAT family N-acetyltransferase [Finegoldia magna]OXZ37938.1 GNAT family N-acetyltransferase [Finegoldia magna]
MDTITVNENIKLVPYFENYETTLKWYEDRDVCKKVDNIDFVYDIDRLQKMYNYLNTHGKLYYIEYINELVGDISLTDDNEITIVVCKEFQNKHIGRNCVKKILELAKEKGLKSVTAKIYAFNHQSKKMFEAVGFKQIDEELFEYKF